MYNALDDEDPAPAAETSESIHLHETEREYATECRGNTTNKVEECVALAHLVAFVPSRHEVDDAGEEASLGTLIIVR